MISKPKVLCLYDKSGCCFYRSYQPLLSAKKQGLLDVEFIQLRTATKKDIALAAHKADIIQAMGLMGPEGLLAVRQYKDLGVKLVIDYDDLHFNCSPFNPGYRNFGFENIELKDPIDGHTFFLWKDGENDFSIRNNKLRFHGYKSILQEADLITTTTLYLRDGMQEIAEGKANLSVLPNAINFQEWKPLDIRDKYLDKFRFGWSVSGSHGEDWTYIRSVLITFLKTHPDAKFVCIGDTFMDVKEGMSEVKEQIEWYPFSDLWEGHYTYRMPMLGLDCAIAPLADNEFNRCKSPLKWEEYTAFGWPTICQNMTPYKEHIEHGKTGLLAGSYETWLKCLEDLYTNEKLRKELRFNALIEVKNTFDLEKVAQEYAEVYTNLVNGEVNVSNQLIT